MKSRRLLHIGFWLAYTLVYALLNTVFAPPSDMKYPVFIRILRFWAGEWIMLPIILGAAYLFVYWLVPQFLLKKKYKEFLLGAVFVFFPAILLNRLANYYLLFPIMYDEFPPYQLFAARRLFFAFIDILPPVAIFATIKLLRLRLKTQQRERALETEKLQSELNFLKAQTNPHFLFNTLNNIYALARKKSDQTAPVILQLSKILRFMLYECGQEKIPIEKEVLIIEDYIQLEKIRYNERLKVYFIKKLDKASTPIAPLLLLPFVENAFKHGSSTTRFDTIIDIHLTLKDNQLTFMIKNEKNTPEEINEGGIGLKNVQRQLELTYPENHSLHIQNEANTFQIDLYITLSE
jgi:hypothetical protein